jgi:transcription-repair coupling factor (superfamily II helicase)
MLLSTVAHSRLNTIVNNTRLGSGYSVAISDLEIRGGGYLFGYKQSGGGGVGYDMYLRLINRSLHESVRPGPVLPVLLEDVSVSIYQKRCIPIEYVSAEDIRLSFYKNLASASSKKDLEDIVYNLLNRFGPLPVPFQNLLKEYRLRLLACEAGVSQISSRGCGIVCKIIIMKSDAFVGAIIDYLKVFLDKDGASFHVLPDSSVGLSLCIHVPEKLDKYTLLSQLLNKFITIK